MARARTACLLVLLLALVAVGRAHVAAPVRISSGSMAPTLLQGDVVLVDQRSLSASDVRRGDLVTFDSPLTDRASLKRVVALPGDTVATVDAVLLVNDEPVEEPYVDFSDWEGVFSARTTVPDGAVFVLGDDRGDSVDSRDFGAVPVERLDGRVLVRLWPPVRVGARPPRPPRQERPAGTAHLAAECRRSERSSGATPPPRCFTPGSCTGATFDAMSDHTIDTKFGRAQVRVHRTAGGWKAMLVGRHLVPCPPPLAGPPARSEAEAVAQLEEAVRSLTPAP